MRTGQQAPLLSEGVPTSQLVTGAEVILEGPSSGQSRVPTMKYTFSSSLRLGLPPLQ